MPATASLVDRIDSVLPQTQCEQCGFHGCRPYAEAIASGEAEINHCPPGGSAGIQTLANLLDRPYLPLDPANGVERARTLARIVEPDCIGCTKCIQVCPVDAIVGAAKLMHTVVSDLCTGCELCVPACPVDCIVLDPMPLAQIDLTHADAARMNFQRREARLRAIDATRDAELSARKATIDAAVPSTGNPVLDALARARARKQEPPKP